MKGLEKRLGVDFIKPTREQKLSMRRSFELQILTAALLRRYILPDKYKELVEKRVGINLDIPR